MTSTRRPELESDRLALAQRIMTDRGLALEVRALHRALIEEGVSLARGTPLCARASIVLSAAAERLLRQEAELNALRGAKR